MHIQDRDLYLFCEFLIHQCVVENDYSARIALQANLHFMHIAGMKALKDGDLEDYEGWSKLRKMINLTWDNCKNQKALSEV